MNPDAKQQWLKTLRFDREGHLADRDDPDGNVRMRWKTVACFKSREDVPTKELGVSENGTWVVPSGDGGVCEVEHRGYWPFFPLLELSFPDAKSLLESEFERHNIPPDLLDDFPFLQITASALKCESHWASDALAWVSFLSPAKELEDGLLFLKDHGRTQRQRHTAAKLLRAARSRL
jgi:hypothetical protein